LVSCFHYFPYVNGLGNSQVTSKLFVSFFYVFIGTYALIFLIFPQKHRINISLQIEIRDLKKLNAQNYTAMVKARKRL
jgi:hypothetical protein